MVTFIGNIRKVGLVDLRADSMGRRKDGSVIIRRGFYYQNGYTAEKFADYILGVLDSVGISATVVDQGEIWKPFKGGASVAYSSHWYVALAEK